MSVQLQQTEIGEFPSAWEIDRVDSAFDIQQGKQVSSRNRDGEHQRPFLRTKNVFWNRLELTDLDEMHFSEAEQSRLELRANDLLVCEGGSIGRTALWNNEVDGCLHQNHLHRLRVKGERADAQFGVYWLWYAFDVAKLYFGRGNVTTIPNLSQSKLAELPMALPPLPEQKKIAHILSTVQRAIEAQERIIQTTTELKKALMHKLFTEGLRHEPQKQTEIGPVPESWEVMKLGEIAKIERGKFSHRPRNEPRFYGGEYPFVQTGDVSNCDGYVRSYTQTLNKDGLAISKMFPAGTILITIAANIGFTGILEFDSACPDSLIGITPNENVQTEFLNYYLITQQPEMDRLAPKNTQKNINIQFLKPWPVPLPSVEEQTEIAGAFSATARKIRLATQKRSQLQDLFRTLLHELMTAKTRVHKLEFEAPTFAP
jgi:type I restriction enzyme S subunit